MAKDIFEFLKVVCKSNRAWALLVLIASQRGLLGFAGAKTSTTSHRVFDTLKKAQTRRVNGVLDNF